MNRQGLLRKVIRIKATDSPNVRYALKQHARGEKPTGQTDDGMDVCPGVLTWQEYVERRASWDKVRQCIGLDGMFYEGAELKMFPKEWLDRAERFAEHLLSTKAKRKARAMGCDPGEGGANSSWCIGDHLGVLPDGLVSERTEDTTVIPTRTVELIRRYNIPPECVLFDRGGGGKQHADYLRQRGFNVRTVGFGSGPDEEAVEGKPSPDEQRDEKERRHEYANRRAQMYHEARELLDPARPALYAHDPTLKVPEAFAIPARLRGNLIDPETVLRDQLEPIPLWYDNEQRIVLPPKRANPATRTQNQVTMTSLIGHSPDEADAFVLMVHGLLHPAVPLVAGLIPRS